MDMNMPPAPAGMGHNQPPSDLDTPALETLLNPAVVRDQLELDHADLLKRRDDLLDGVKRFFATVPKIEDDAMQARAADFVAQLKLHVKEVEAERVKAQAPLIACQRAKQKFFKADIQDPLEGAASDIEGQMTRYSRAKAAANRALLDEQARQATREAQAKMAQAAEANRPSVLEDAAAAAATAERAVAKAASATDAELGRTRSVTGAVAMVRTTWDFEVVDLAQVPDSYKVLDAAKVRAEIAAGLRDAGDVPAIPGLRIVSNLSTKVRA